MEPRRSKQDILDRDFLDTRSRILDLAASLDRLDRASRESAETPDPRLARLRQAIEALLIPEPGRAETIQLIFSLTYDPDWRDRFEMPERLAGT